MDQPHPITRQQPIRQRVRTPREQVRIGVGPAHQHLPERRRQQVRHRRQSDTVIGRPPRRAHGVGEVVQVGLHLHQRHPQLRRRRPHPRGHRRPQIGQLDQRHIEAMDEHQRIERLEMTQRGKERVHPTGEETRPTPRRTPRPPPPRPHLDRRQTIRIPGREHLLPPPQTLHEPLGQRPRGLDPQPPGHRHRQRQNTERLRRRLHRRPRHPKPHPERLAIHIHRAPHLRTGGPNLRKADHGRVLAGRSSRRGRMEVQSRLPHRTVLGSSRRRLSSQAARRSGSVPRSRRCSTSSAW